MRLDHLLVKREVISSRQRAKEAILQGQVFVDGKKVTKPGQKVSLDAEICIKGQQLPYPSRAGLKLEKALQVFTIDIVNMVTMDVGASTGGFTSCLLQNGAQKVFAVDVGKNQIVTELREDPRVIVFENTNIRTVTPQLLGEFVDLATIDVSFISLEKVIPHVVDTLKPEGQIISLIKPQFETEGIGLNKRGVIGNIKTHLKFLPPLLNRLQGANLGLCNFDFSPISGNKGNLEFLAHFKMGAKVWDSTELIKNVINLGWQSQSEREGSTCY